ncbi:hypothetical protein [Agromyces sp. NBRC 114283]|uniref:hypothetical protein n=1 Tax=Agromyces sp. NBRC 114283 TaxID=2994521 RepID=UPI0024A42136|nr:hypothetical protein [Agromyces sp. NBRC 114283]GLU90296.1 hypothetical protein Agsp01_25510 [Agromyces sp. NBRC 114283]
MPSPGTFDGVGLPRNIDDVAPWPLQPCEFRLVSTLVPATCPGAVIVAVTPMSPVRVCRFVVARIVAAARWNSGVFAVLAEPGFTSCHGSFTTYPFSSAAIAGSAGAASCGAISPVSATTPAVSTASVRMVHPCCTAASFPSRRYWNPNIVSPESKRSTRAE